MTEKQLLEHRLNLWLTMMEDFGDIHRDQLVFSTYSQLIYEYHRLINK